MPRINSPIAPRPRDIIIVPRRSIGAIQLVLFDDLVTIARDPENALGLRLEENALGTGNCGEDEAVVHAIFSPSRGYIAGIAQQRW